MILRFKVGLSSDLGESAHIFGSNGSCCWEEKHDTDEADPNDGRWSYEVAPFAKGKRSLNKGDSVAVYDKSKYDSNVRQVQGWSGDVEN